MEDRTRIKILKGLVAISAGAALLNAAEARRLQKENRRLRKQGGIAGKIIRRFTELSSEEIQSKIVDQFEFEWVTKDLDL